MAASLKGLSAELRTYIKDHKLPDIYEALLSGIAVMCPPDPLQFILDKLRQLKEQGLEDLHWDMFVDESLKPKVRIFTESNLDILFNFDEHLLPTPEMYAKAYGHYNKKILELCFNAWMQYHLLQKHKQSLIEEKMNVASQHHAHRLLREHLHIWKEWIKYRKGRQAMAFQILEHVNNIAVDRVIFQAWHNHTVDAKRQREYFERLERGENMEEDDMFGDGTGEARDSVSALARNVAIKIFGYLDVADIANCACVCRSWKVLTQASMLWSRIDFYRVRKRVTDKVATRLLFKARPYMIHLNLRGCHHLTKPTFVTVSECRNIQDLNLSECLGLDDETLKMMAKGCKILLYLNISHTGLTDASLRALAKYCWNLQYLSLAFCCKFTDRGLLYLASGKCNKKLEYLDVSGCLQITPEGFRNLANGCTNLQSLILNEFPTLNDECVMTVAEKCAKLHTVSFLGSPLITDEPFKKLASHKNLRVIKIDGNHRISDAALKVIGKQCLGLEHLYMTDCQRITDSALKALGGCKNLRVINLADCVRISDSGVRHLVDGLCASQLRELNLTNCIRVGDMAMVNIHKRCHSLTYLSVCFCEHISEAGVELLGQTHSLISLDISGCNCGDQGLSALGNNVRLRDVTLSECGNITDLGLQKFAQQCREVQRLDISHCMNITDGAIKNLAFCCRMLTVLNVSGCKLVTDLSLQYLSGVCHYLAELDISGCYLISDKAMKYLRKGCKKLQGLTMLYCKGISKRLVSCPHWSYIFDTFIHPTEGSSTSVHAAQKMSRHLERVQYSADEVPGFFGYQS